MTISWPNYQKVLQVLETIDAEIDVSELQGMQLGLICGSNKKDESSWVNTCLEHISETAIHDDETRDICRQLLLATLQSVQDPDLKLRIFLPDDKESTQSRVEALGIWCRGFLYGIGLSGITKEHLAQGDVAEMIKDINEIAKISFSESEEESTEEAERHLQELVEYIRITVMTLFCEIAQTQWGPSSQHLH